MEDPQVQHLIIRYLSREASRDEESELLDWVSSSPSHQIYFDDWKRIWNNQPPTETPFELSKGLDRLNKAITDSENKHGGWQRIAASISIIVLMSFAIYLIASRPTSSTSITFRELRTKPGQRTTYSLQDGSLVILNANSSLRYPAKFENDTREVFLSGEAFFQVSRDSLRPFIIHFGDLRTHVLGTAFNINATPGAAEITVVSGKVQVIAGNISEVVHPKEKVVYHLHDRRMIKLESNLDELAWKDNVIIFQDASMHDVARKLHEFYGMSVRFENDSIKKCFVTGKFTNKPLNVVLNAISFSTGIHYIISGDTVTLSGSGCE